eukprot:1086293-Pelagomonas_calceolata.AAC.4
MVAQLRKLSRHAHQQAAAMHRMAQDTDDEESLSALLEGGGRAGCPEGVLVALADSLMGSEQGMQVGRHLQLCRLESQHSSLALIKSKMPPREASMELH